MRVPHVLVVGPLPPPRNGMTEMTRTVLDHAPAEFVVDHLDTSDHRPIGNVARFDVQNVGFALRHGFGFALRAVIRRPDLVYLPIARDRLGFLRDTLFLFPARLLGLRVLVHLHAREFSGFAQSQGPAFRLLIRLALGRRTRGIVLSESMCTRLQPYIAPEAVAVVPNGIPDPGAGPDAARREAVVLYLSTLWSRKGLFDFVEAAARVRDTCPDARFVLAGGWLREDERTVALARIEQLGLGSVLTLAGPVEPGQKWALLKSSAVACLPSYDEGLPLVVLEALACGCPVVASAVGGIPDAVEHGVHGFLHEPGDVQSMAEAVVTLLGDPDFRGRVGRAARSRYEDRYTVDRFSASLAQSWRDAIARPPAVEVVKLS